MNPQPLEENHAVAVNNAAGTTLRRVVMALVSLVVIVTQLAAPALAAAKTIQEQRAMELAAQPRGTLKPALTPGEMEAALNLLLEKLPAGFGMQPASRAASRLIVADYRAFIETPIGRQNPFRRDAGLVLERFQRVPLAEINAAFIWMFTSLLNMPMSLDEASRQAVQDSFDIGVFVLALHYQVELERSAAEAQAARENPADSRLETGLGTQQKPGIQARTAAKKTLQSIRIPRAAGASAGFAGNKQVHTAALQPGPLSGIQGGDQLKPGLLDSLARFLAARETRTFGSLRITADTFTDLGGGAVQASGSVWLGAVGGSGDFYQLSGAGDSVTLNGAALSGQGTLVLRSTGKLVFQGSFTADGSVSQPVIIPTTLTLALDKLGNFSLQGSPTLAQVDLFTGITSGQAQVLANPPGIEKILAASFTLGPGGEIGGVVQDFTMTVAGTLLAITSPQLTSSAIQADGTKMTMPAQFGQLSQDITGFALTPDNLVLGNSAGAKFPIPDILFGDGQVLKLTDLTGVLSISAQGIGIGAAGTADLNYPGNAQDIPFDFALDTSGNLRGALEEISLNISGFMLRVVKPAISNEGFSAAEGTLTAPDWLNNASSGVTDLLLNFTAPYIHFKEGYFNLPELKWGDDFSIGGRATLFTVPGGYAFDADAVLKLTPPGDNPQFVDFQLTYRDGQFTGVIKEFRYPLLGGKLVVKDVGFNNDGLFVKQGEFYVPTYISKFILTEKIIITDIYWKEEGLVLAGGMKFQFPDFYWDDGSVLKITGISANLIQKQGVYMITLEGALHITEASYKVDSKIVLLWGDDYWAGSLDTLELATDGFRMKLLNVVVDSTGVNADLVRLTFPKIAGGLTFSIQDISITGDGISVGCSMFRIPDIPFGDGTQGKLTNLKGTIIANKGVYTFGLSGTVELNISGLEQTIDFSGSIDTQGSLAVLISGFKMNMGEFSLEITNVKITNDGLSVDSGTLFLPQFWGGVTAKTQAISIPFKEGRLFIQGEIIFADHSWGNNKEFSLVQVKATLTTTSSSYVFALSGTAVFDPFRSGETRIPVSASIDLNARFSAKIEEFSIKYADFTFHFMGTEINNEGWKVGSTELIFPAWSGPTIVQVPGVTWDKDGIRFNGSLSIEVKVLPWGIGSAVKFRDLKATLVQQGGVTMFDFRGTLDLQMPGNSQLITVSFWWYSNGEIAGAINGFSFNLSGIILRGNQLVIGLDSKGFKLSADRFLVVVPIQGQEFSIEARQLIYDKDGLQIAGGVTLRLPEVLTIADNQRFGLKFLQSMGSFAIQRAGGETKYIWMISSTIELRFAKNAFKMPAQFRWENGQWRLTLPGWKVDMGSGWKWTASNPVISNTGISIAVSTLTVPQWGDLTVQNATVDWQEGVKFYNDIGVPDINWGGAVIIRNMLLRLGWGIVDYEFTYVLGLSGTVSFRIGSFKMDVTFYGMIVGGYITGTIDNLTIQFSTWKLILRNLKLTKSMLYVESGILVIPFWRGEVHNVRIDGEFPFVHFEEGAGAVVIDGSAPPEADFIISTVPEEASLGEGEGKAVQVVVAGINGAIDPVNISLLNPPSGLLYSFDNTLLLPGETATLAFTDTALLANGSYGLVISGIDISHTHTTTLTLDVAKAGFDLSAEPFTQTVKPGQAVTYTLKLGSNNWTEPVQLSLSSMTMLPPEINAGFVTVAGGEAAPTATVTVPTTAYLVVSTDANVLFGSFLIEVLAQSRDKQYQAEMGVEIVQPRWQVFMPLAYQSSSQ